AKRYGVSRPTIERVADSMSPYGITWRQLAIQRIRDEGESEFIFKLAYETKSSREFDRQMEELVDKSSSAAPSAADRLAKPEPRDPFQEWKQELAGRAKYRFREIKGPIDS